MFYGQCWKCGERWSLGTASTCTCEPEQVISYSLTDPLPKPVMTLSSEGLWVDPDLSVDEAAKAVLSAIDTQVNIMVTEAVKQERNRIVNLLMIQHEMAKGAHNYWNVAAQLIQADVGSDT